VELLFFGAATGLSDEIFVLDDAWVAKLSSDRELSKHVPKLDFVHLWVIEHLLHFVNTGELFVTTSGCLHATLEYLCLASNADLLLLNDLELISEMSRLQF